VKRLPLSCRPGILAARYIYAGIGGRVQAMGHDSISTRAHTSKGQKLGWLGLAMLRAGTTLVMPRSPLLYAQPLTETAFLVDAAARDMTEATDRVDRFHAALAQVAQQEAARKSSLMQGALRPN